jgi:DNA-directed RNA polymerase specialized sigma24 family protein
MDVPRQAAGTVLLPELQRLAQGLVHGRGFPEHFADDAAAEAFCSLMTGGNKSNSAVACDSEARVRGFLKECVRNAMLDELRRQKRIEQLDPSVAASTVESTDGSPEETAIASEEVAIRQMVEREFYDRVVPALAESLRPSAARDLTQAVQHMRALANGEKDFNSVVLEAVGRNDEAAHAAVHQRHSRTRRRLVEYIEHLETAGHVSQQQAGALRWCVSQLQRRASS